jgi:prolipoprotein diacylglyceryltransferase
MIISERWQILASVPVYKLKSGAWVGTNLTYYGLFCATAESLAVALAVFLLTASGMPLGLAALLILLMASACLPAARWVAQFVDGKPYNFSVAGAAGVGMLVLTVIIIAFDIAGLEIPAASVFAAVTISYVFGEGIGRLACISFGCCYGKPVRELPPFLRKLFRRFHFIFEGRTKKIAHEAQPEGVAVAPIQAISCFVYLLLACTGLALFLRGATIAAFLFTATCGHLWRIVSETLRADYRGGGSYSIYQLIAADLITCSWAIASFLSESGTAPDIWTGLRALWRPHVILLFQAFWLIGFYYHGKSMVTDSEIVIRVREDRI